MKIRYAPLAVACALMMAASAHAEVITYYFEGKITDAGNGSALSVNDAFTGSFTFDSTAVDLSSSVNEGTYFTGVTVQAMVNGQSFSSGSSASLRTLFNFMGIDVVQVFSGPISLPQPNDFSEVRLYVEFSANHDVVFESDALPTATMLTSPLVGSTLRFDFFTSTTYSGPLGTLEYVGLTNPTAVPEASTSAMLALGLGVVALTRRRKSSDRARIAVAA